jgi:hypothetical protein
VAYLAGTRHIPAAYLARYPRARVGWLALKHLRGLLALVMELGVGHADSRRPR